MSCLMLCCVVVSWPCGAELVDAIQRVLHTTRDHITLDVAKGCLWTLGTSHGMKMLQQYIQLSHKHNHLAHASPHALSPSVSMPTELPEGFGDCKADAALPHSMSCGAPGSPQAHLMISYEWGSQKKVGPLHLTVKLATCCTAL